MFIDVWNCFVLLLIDDWQLAMQVKIRQSFFRQCLAVALFAKLFDCQSFLLYGSELIGVDLNV